LLFLAQSDLKRNLPRVFWRPILFFPPCTRFFFLFENFFQKKGFLAMSAESFCCLPTDLVEAVLGNLHFKDIYAVRGVCRALRHSRAAWRSIRLRNADDAKLAQLAATASLSTVRELKILFGPAAKKISEQGFSQLAAFACLERLVVCSLENRLPLHVLLPLKSLKVLQLTRCAVANSELGLLAQLNLEHLGIKLGFNLSLGGMQHLSELKSLTKLVLNQNITDRGLEHLRPLLNLQSFTSEWSTNITDNGLVHFVAFPNLHTLNLCFASRVTDLGLAHLAALPQLVNLRVEDATITTTEPLVNLSKLETLSLSGCRAIPRSGFWWLRRLSKLQVLHLALCCAPAIEDLASLPLQYLNLASTSIDEATLLQLCALKSLTRLDLTQNQNVTDRIVAELSKLPSLRVIELVDCEQLTEECLVALGTCPSLETLHVTCCPQFSDAAIDAFVATLQNKRIH